MERKRKISADLPPAADDEDDVIGPMPVSAEKVAKKRKGKYRFSSESRLILNNAHPTAVLPFEKIYLDNLPCAEMYEKSYMHRDVITHVLSTK